MAANNGRSLEIESPLSVATFNVRGINNAKKRNSIVRSLKREKVDVVAFQETYLTDENDYEDLKRRWGGNLHFNYNVVR